MLMNKPSDKIIGSGAYIEVYNKAGSIDHNKINSACHGSVNYYTDMSIKTFDYAILKFEVAKTPYSEADFIEWLQFCDMCHFPSIYEGIKIETSGTKSIYFYIVRLESKYYKKPLYLFAAITIIRLISYYFIANNPYANIKAIPYHTIKLYEYLKKEVSPIECLWMMHSIASDRDHMILSYDRYTKPITNEQFIKRLSNNAFKSLNLDSFENSLFISETPINIENVKDLNNYLEKEKYSQFLKKIKWTE